MIEVVGLTKRYGTKLALDHVSFSVKPGEVLGFLGPNGAGKTTTMNIITGYLSSSEGSVTVGGFDVLEEPVKTKSQIGYLPEHPPLYTNMTVNEYLSFIYDLKKVKLIKKAHIEDICDQTWITNVRQQLIGNLSKGFRQRVGLAQALLGHPPVLILDEPTIGLDPKQIIEMRTLIQDLGKHHTIILSSHILQEIQATCKRIIIIHQGALVADGELSTLAQSYNKSNRIIIRVRGHHDDVSGALVSLPEIRNVELLGSYEYGTFDFAVESGTGVDIRSDVFFALADRKWPLLSMRTSELSLEELFLRLTTAQIPVSQVEADESEGVNI